MAIRIFWRMNPGRNVVNLNWPALSADSVVSVQASEYAAGSQQLPDSTEQRFIGAADVTVESVTPHGPPFDPNRGVTFVVNVALGGQLNVCTDIALIANAPEQVLWIGPRTVSGGTQSETGMAGLAAPGGVPEAAASTGPVTYHSATITGPGAAADSGASAPPVTVSTSIEVA